MAASPSVVALPWYARGDYPALLKLFSDSYRLPTTYDAWLERAEEVERQFQSGGFVSPRSGFDLFPLRPGARSGTSRPIKRRA
jgi:hypothetical protein